MIEKVYKKLIDNIGVDITKKEFERIFILFLNNLKDAKEKVILDKEKNDLIQIIVDNLFLISFYKEANLKLNKKLKLKFEYKYNGNKFHSLLFKNEEENIVIITNPYENLQDSKNEKVFLMMAEGKSDLLDKEELQRVIGKNNYDNYVNYFLKKEKLIVRNAIYKIY